MIEWCDAATALSLSIVKVIKLIIGGIQIGTFLRSFY